MRPSDEPAFPRSYSHDGHNGMTLRDYFAGQALSILPARSWEVDGKTPDNILKIWAKTSYALADAMLEARK